MDIGAYEFQHPTSVISYAWLEQYGFPIDGSADFTDRVHDGMDNYQEWIAGTDPTNAASVLQMQAPSNAVSGVEVSWQSVATRNYFLTRTASIAPQQSFSTIATNIRGQTNTTTYLDTDAFGAGLFFYRVAEVDRGRSRIIA